MTPRREAPRIQTRIASRAGAPVLGRTEAKASEPDLQAPCPGPRSAGLPFAVVAACRYEECVKLLREPECKSGRPNEEDGTRPGRNRRGRGRHPALRPADARDRGDRRRPGPAPLPAHPQARVPAVLRLLQGARRL